MGKKTALFGGFLLLVLLVAGVSGGVLYYRAHQFQLGFQAWAQQSHLEFGHLRFGMGDLEQTDTFPRSTGQFRFNVQNRCTGELIDLGLVKYSMGHVPQFDQHGLLQWFPPGWEDAQGLLELDWQQQATGWAMQLKPSAWMQTIALNPSLTIQQQDQAHQVSLQADLIKLADITQTPDDFLARDVKLQIKLNPAQPLDSSLEFSASQLSQGAHSLGNTEVRVTADSQEDGQIEWALSSQSQALKWGDWLLTNVSAEGKLLVGDTAAGQLILASAVQSCGGFATAKSHEFKVQSAYNSLIQKGLKGNLKITASAQGAPVLFNTEVRMNPQIDFNTGQIHLGRSIEIEHEQDIPFQKTGRKQREQALATGLFSELELMGRHQQKWTRNSMMLQMQLAQLGKTHSRTGDSLADRWAHQLKTGLDNWEQALYLREFALTPQADSIQRVDFEGLQGVRIDAQGGVRKLLPVR